MKVWYFICILFSLYSIDILINEGSKITYVPSNDEEIKLNYSLACFNLKLIFSNKTTIDLRQLDENAYAYFDNYYSKFIEETFNEYEERIKKEFKIKVNETILNPIKSKNYFVLRDQFCLILVINPGFVVKYFKNLKYYILNNATYDLLKLNRESEKFAQIIVINKDNSNCLTLDPFSKRTLSMISLFSLFLVFSLSAFILQSLCACII